MPKTMDSYRALRLAGDPAAGIPATLNADERSVEVLAATEQPTRVFDWDRGVIDEVLLMSGLELPASRQVPLLDTHSRYSTSAVIGSFRGMAVDGSGLVGRAMFSSVEEASGPWTKVAEGHLTDFSVGYRVIEAVWVEAGKSETIGGRSFSGPVKVVTRWKVKELSVCPIGADEMAKARADQPAPTEKENLMDQKLRAFLERRGLPKDATEQEAYAYLERMDAGDPADNKPAKQNTPPAEPARSDIDALVAGQVKAERERTAEITALCERHGCRELAQEMVADGRSVDAARQAVLDHLAKSQGPAGHGYRAPLAIGVDERDKFRAAAEDGLLLRAGLAGESLAAGADALAGYSLRELARHALTLAGEPAGGDPMTMLGRALTSSDLPAILANVMNKSLQEGYESAGETWEVWCATGSVTDFKENTLASIGEFGDLEELPEGTPYSYGERVDAKETFKVATYGRLFSINRQVLIDDDLGALTDTPMAMGDAAARKIGDLPYAVLTANSAMRDGKALFHSDHKNIGTSGVIGTTTLSEAVKLLGQQKDLSGKRRLNIPLQYVIAPGTVQGAAEIFFASTSFSDGATNTTAVGSTRANIFAGNRITQVYDARLNGSSDTDVVWYAAGPKGKTVKVFFLNGNRTPYLESRIGWNVDGIEYKVRIDAGAKAVDWKALIRNAGV